jgi:hypothetical protein
MDLYSSSVVEYHVTYKNESFTCLHLLLLQIVACQVGPVHLGGIILNSSKLT